MIYSFWIFDRHCNCVYAKDWHSARSDPVLPPTGISPNGDFSYRRSQPPLAAPNMLMTDLAAKSGLPLSVTNTNAKIQNSPYPTPLFDNELAKLVFGLVFSLAGISKKLVGTPATKNETGMAESATGTCFPDPTANLAVSNGASAPPDSFISFSTNKYKLHFYETPSRIRFVLVTDPDMDSQLSALKHIYSNVYLEYAVKNPLFPVDPVGSAVLSSDLLIIGIESFITSLQGFE